MPTDTLHAAKPSLAYAKLVATPTESAWAQVYNAGNLFACLSLSLEQPTEGISLPVIGKEVVNNLEAEFFTLEEKNLTSIKKAIQDSIEKVPEEVSVNLSLACFKDDILYLFIVGEGRIVMKRDEKVGVLLDKKKEHPEILTASGYVENKDIIVLETKQFAESIQDTTLTSALELALPNDIAEALSPQLHEIDDGGQAAIIVVYHGIAKNVEEENPEHSESLIMDEEPKHGQPLTYDYQDEADEENEETTDQEQKAHFKMPTLPSLPTKLSSLRIPRMQRITHTKKLFLSIILILIFLLGVSIYLTKQQQESKQTQELFQSIYVPAQKKYDEGVELKTLNQSLSREDFTEAEDLLKDGIPRFKQGSREEQQLSDLLSKVQTELGGTGATPTETDMIQAKEATIGKDSYLAIQQVNSGLSFAQDNSKVYSLSADGITAITKNSGSKKEQLANDDFWSNPVALSPYQGNMYVLDTKKGILKFVSSSGKPSSYFTGSKPNLNTATAMAIDGSIWILLKDGTILKYTRGQNDNFKVQGMDTSMNNAAKIFTGLDVDNVYVLDKGNSRIVVLDKKGNFVKSYAASIIKNAKDFEVLEKDKKVLILSGNKIWEIAL